MHMTSGYLNSQLGAAAGVATQVKVGAGKLISVTVIVPGAVGAIYDSASVGGVGAANQIAVLPAAIGVYTFWFPFFNGLVIAPGVAQTWAVSFE
jgi:hypothetical protein